MELSIRPMLRRSAALFGRELRSPAFLSVLVVIGIYNVLLAQPNFTTDLLTGGWIFDSAPAVAASYLLTWGAVSLLLVGWVSRVVLTLVVTQQMYRISLGQEIRTKSLLRGLKVSDLVWYALCSAFLFGVAVLAVLVIWVAGWSVWITWHVDLTVIILFICALGYPLYVSWLATTALLAILPVGRRDRLRGLKLALGWRVARGLYLYYFMRVGLEYGLGALVLYIGAMVSPGSVWVHVAGSVLLVTPLLFLRTATYTRTVDVMSTVRELAQALGGSSRVD